MPQITTAIIMKALFDQFGYMSQQTGFAILDMDSELITNVHGKQDVAQSKLFQEKALDIIHLGLLMGNSGKSGKTTIRIEVDDYERTILGKLGEQDFELFLISRLRGGFGFLIHQNSKKQLDEHREACQLAAELLSKLAD